MKISGATTLDELRIERKRLGVTHLMVSVKPMPPIVMSGTPIELAEVNMVVHEGKMIYAAAGTISEALTKAFDERERQIAALIERDGQGKP